MGFVFFNEMEKNQFLHIRINNLQVTTQYFLNSFYFLKFNL
ncbi:hypothetical protein NU08_1511 [Flavobacterium anhuiense]|uniref:Uncharacterized protein n=1 Tax=Flavobacterium anhuiense TaxID=459526 RepID=A0A444W056_9FLAO|nr:hypothetical protein NU08_1511 [Flavobacterium anhuiense]